MAFLIGGANTESAVYEIDNSVRFNVGDSPHLEITPSSTGDEQKWTFSTWVKRCDVTSSNDLVLIGAFTTNSDNQCGIVLRGSSDNCKLQSFCAISGTANNGYNFETSQVFRDPAAWYHIVIATDTTQSTNTNGVKFYVNGSQITSFGATTYNQNINTQFNTASSKMQVGARASDDAQELDGYLADTYWIDGSQLTASDFGKTDSNGVWIPKKASPTFGTNGFKLEYQQTGTSANASGIGADTSGNGNHLTPTNLAATDITTDTPTNNFATMNPLDNYHSGFTFSEGNCKFVTAGSSNAYNTATIGDLKKGKWYLEVRYTDPSHTGGGDAAGEFYGAISAIGHKLSDGASDTDTSTDLYATSYLHNFGYDGNNGRIKNNNTAGTVHGASISADGQIIGFLLDLDNNRVTTHLNGQYADGSGNHDESSPTSYVSITAPASTPLGGYMIGFDETIGSSESGNQNTGTYEINFGNPSFSISSGNADANGYGNFEYAVPSGYYALCTKNLAEYG
tara:strand:+ start:401 stop:1930 length:1530 start_codon:yes stop_codon:yes gene_type:complete